MTSIIFWMFTSIFNYKKYLFFAECLIWFNKIKIFDLHCNPHQKQFKSMAFNISASTSKTNCETNKILISRSHGIYVKYSDNRLLISIKKRW